MAKKAKQPTISPPQLGATAVLTLPQPAARKAEEYLQAYSGYVYTATSAIAQEVASIDLKLFKVKYLANKEPEVDEIFTHPSLSVLHYANPLVTFYDLVEATQVYLELVGEAFWVVLKDTGGMPREIWPIRPDWVTITPSVDSVIDHYTYNPGGVFGQGVTLPRENVIHFKNLHPLNPYRGKGTVQAAAMPIDVLQFAQEWNRNFFFNSATPGLVFTTDQKFTPEVLKRFVTQWQESYGGRSKAHKVAFLSGGFKLDKTSADLRELDFVEQQKILRDDILATFRVPKTILGLTDDVNRANALATSLAFMERVITPRMRKLVGTLNEFLLPMFGVEEGATFFDFVDPSPEDVETKLKYYENARKYTWMTPNEIRVEENLEPVEGGDDLFTPVLGSKAPTSGAPADNNGEGEENENEETNEEEKGLLSLFKKKKKTAYRPPVYLKGMKRQFKHMMPIPPKPLEVIEREALEKGLTKDLSLLIGEMLKGNGVKRHGGTPKKVKTKEEREDYWFDFVEKTSRKEVEFRRKIVSLFEEQERETLLRLEGNKHLAKDLRIEKGVSDWLFDLKEWAARWGGVLIPFLRELVIQRGDEVLVEVGVNQPFDTLSSPVSDYLREHAAEFIFEINKTTREELKETLAKGVEEKEGVAQLRKRVNEVFKQATKERAAMIARTEVIRASNFASKESYRQSGVVKGVEWLSEKDDRVCEHCLDLDGKTIELEENFFSRGDEYVVNGKTMRFEVADVGYPPLHPKCYSKDTEIYTKEGWKLIKDVKKDETVLTLVPETKDLEWGKVIATTSHKEEEILELKNNQHSFDMAVSENHPFFGYKRVDHEPNGRFVEPVSYDSIKDLPREEFRFCVSSNWVGDNAGSLYVANRKFSTEQFVRFMAFYLSEGSVTLRKKGGYQISITQTKFLEEMAEEIKLMPLEKVCVGKEKIYIYDQEMAKYLKQFGKSSEKYVPEGIKNLSPIYLKEFISAYAMGDGSVQRGKFWKGSRFNDNVQLSTSSKRMADDLGEIIIKSGNAVSYNLEKTKGKKQVFRNGTYIINNDQWNVYVLNAKYRFFKNVHVKRLKYNDLVYDVEVDKNHTILTRRNGKVVWGSNCRCSILPVLYEEGEKALVDQKTRGAEEKAAEIIKEAVSSANKIVTEAENLAKEKESRKTKEVEEAVKEASALVSEARREAKTVLTRSEGEARDNLNAFKRIIVKGLKLAGKRVKN